MADFVVEVGLEGRVGWADDFLRWRQGQRFAPAPYGAAALMHCGGGAGKLAGRCHHRVADRAPAGPGPANCRIGGGETAADRLRLPANYQWNSRPR
jgi:hypothetical protein